MKHKRNFLTAIFALSLSLAFMSCSDDPQPAYEYKTQGYIKGTITGSTKDNSYTFTNEKFNFTQYNWTLDETASVYTANSGGSYSIYISRADYNGSGAAEISFLLSNSTDTTPENIEYRFSYGKEEKDRFISFNMSDDDNNTVTISDLKFDSTTGETSGKFTITGPANSTEKTATITGEFNVIAKKTVR